MTQTDNKARISPLKHAAQMGLQLGGFLMLIYIAWMYTPSHPILGLFSLIGLIGTPFYAYRLGLRFRNLIPSDVPYPFAIAWSHGTQMFIFAGIILLLPTYYYYTSVLPEQLPVLESILSVVYQRNPGLKATLYAAYGGDPLALISGLAGREHIWGLLWSGFSNTVFLGAIVSLINALILKRPARPTH